MGVAIVDAPSWGEVNTEDDLIRANAHWAEQGGVAAPHRTVNSSPRR
jgi:hypothetical protein